MENNLVSVEDFCMHHAIEITFIQSLEEYGLIQTSKVEKANFLNLDDLDKLERYLRLYQELEINLEGLHAVAHLLNQMNVMQDKILNLKKEISYYKQMH